MTALRKQVDQAALDGWAGLSGDYNPLHCDPAYAATTRYRRTIVHGHLTVAWLCEAALREWGPAWIGLGSIADLRFRAPLHTDVEYVVEVDSEAADDNRATLRVLLPDGTAAVTATAALTESSA